MGTRGKIVRLSLFAAVAALVASVALTAGSPSVWIDVPFIAQSKEGCGSASIAMVMQYWQKKDRQADSAAANPEKIQRELFSAEAGGIFASSMEKYFREAGYRVFAFEGKWADLRHHLEQGRPLIVGLKPSGGRGPYHYVVVVGVDSERGYVFLNDPAQQKMLRVSQEGFESEWKFTQNWTLLAVPQPAD